MDEPTGGNPAPRVVAAADASVLAQAEAARRPRAAKRLGLFQTDLTHAVNAIVPIASAFMVTAAGIMELQRRPKASARRVGPTRIERDETAVMAVPPLAAADTACAAMETARRPRAAARAETLRREHAPRSVLHPEQVGAFALLPTQDETERAFASWRAGGVTTSPNAVTLDTDFAQLKASLSSAHLAVEPPADPFAALERMLDVHMSSSPSSRGGSLRGASGFSGTTSSRGGSTRGASAFSHTRRGGSRHGAGSANSERDAPREAVSSGNVVPRIVHCSLESDGVVCRVDDDECLVDDDSECGVVARVAIDGVNGKVAALALSNAMRAHRV